MNARRKTIPERIRETRLFLFDLDGTVYRGNKLVPGAKKWFRYMRERGIHYLFLTNNSSRRASEYVTKLASLSIEATIETIMTSGQAVGMHLARTKPGSRVFLVGTNSLASELASYGLTITKGNEPADCVVVGFDTELTYAKIETACALIDRGADYIATNPDLVCPIEHSRSLPDCGSICFMIEQATGRKPRVFGKPRPAMVDLARARYGIPASKTAIVGDRLYTDIAAGKNAGVLALCVLSGESTRKDIARSPVKPDFVITSIDELNRIFGV